MRPNWFLALPVSPIPWFEERVPEPPQGLRRFPAEDLHLTAAFLGGCDEEAARLVWSRASDWQLTARRVVLGEVTPMGRPGRYSALSALFERGAAEIEAEIGRCRAEWLAAAGARPEHRPPRAHVTIARPRRRATDDERAAGLAWAAGLDLSGAEVELGELALYTWADDRSRRLFRIVERRPL
jgi:2'-5' RNA ligase